VLAAIDEAERVRCAMELAESSCASLAIDGYRARARAAAIMHGLGFKATDHERAVAEFSGGWRVRLAMARALCSRADLLLLDEPTNHLDLDAIVWLEEWLTGYSGHAADDFSRPRIPRCDHRPGAAHREPRIRAYSGNYSQFEQKRAEELALQQALQARQFAA
jgi:ATP-binding cassette, subfamily F, member 3